jgi:hypothetical protein
MENIFPSYPALSLPLIFYRGLISCQARTWRFSLFQTAAQCLARDPPPCYLLIPSRKYLQRCFSPQSQLVGARSSPTLWPPRLSPSLWSSVLRTSAGAHLPGRSSLIPISHGRRCSLVQAPARTFFLPSRAPVFHDRFLLCSDFV